MTRCAYMGGKGLLRVQKITTDKAVNTSMKLNKLVINGLS